MNILKKLTKKDLKLNRKRSIVTIIGILLSAALITAVTTMVSTFKSSIISYEIQTTGNFNYEFINVPKSDLKYFENNKSIEFISKVYSMGYAKVDSINEYKPYVGILGFDETALNELIPAIVEGRAPKNDTEILVSNHLKTNGGVEYKLGDEITLDVGIRYDEDGNILEFGTDYLDGETLDNTVKKTYKVVGFIDRLDNTIEGYSEPGYSLVTLSENSDQYNVYAKYTQKGINNRYEVTSNILGFTDTFYIDTNGFTNIYEYAEENNIEIEDAYKKSTEMLNDAKYSYESNEYLNILETNIFKNTALRVVLYVAIIVIAIIIVTSVFCIQNSFNISITEKTKLYGMLRSIGATKKQIKRNVLYEAFTLGFIGIPLGILLGIFASYILVLLTNALTGDFLYSCFNLNISWIGIIASVLLGLVTIYLSAIRGARRASKISPIVAIRGNEDIKSKRIRSNKLIGKIFGIGGTISDKNLKRNKKKYRTTVISIFVCVTTFIALSTFMNIAFDAVDLMIEDYDYNLLVRLTDDDAKENYKKIKNYVETSDLVNNYSIINQKFYYVKDFKISERFKEIYDIEEDSSIQQIEVIKVGNKEYKNYLKSLGLDYDEYKDKSILINTSKESYSDDQGNNKKEYVKLSNYKQGDTIKLFYDNGDYVDDDSLDADVSEEKWEDSLKEFKEETISYVTDKFPFAVSDDNEAILVVSDEYYDTFETNENESYQETIYIESKNADKLQDEINKMINSDDYYIFNVDGEYKSMKSLFILVEVFLYGFIIVIALIGVTNIFNTITTTVALRSNEFAMLKSIGMTNKEFNRMISLESLFLGIKSLIFGIPVGTFLGYLIYTVSVRNSDGVLPYRLPINGILISIVVVFILIFSLMKYSVSKISKQNIIETIRNENI